MHCKTKIERAASNHIHRINLENNKGPMKTLIYYILLLLVFNACSKPNPPVSTSIQLNIDSLEQEAIKQYGQSPKDAIDLFEIGAVFLILFVVDHKKQFYVSRLFVRVPRTLNFRGLFHF